MHTYREGGRFTHPYEMGSNVYCETIHDAEAVEAAKRLVRRAGYYGPMAVEFRRDPADESLVLIKADPRFVRATSLSRAIGLDMPTRVYSVFSGSPVADGDSYPDGVGWIWLTSYMTALFSHRSDQRVRGDLFGLLKNLRRIRGGRLLRSAGPLAVPGEPQTVVVGHGEEHRARVVAPGRGSEVRRTEVGKGAPPHPTPLPPSGGEGNRELVRTALPTRIAAPASARSGTLFARARRPPAWSTGPSTERR